MSYANLVLSQVSVPLSVGATTITLIDIGAPYQLPPTGGGILVLSDSPAKPSVVEIIKYTSRSGLVLSGVTRGQEGTTALAWALPTFSLMSLTAQDFQTQLDSKEPSIAVGTTAQYWRGDKSWRDFMTDVRASTLTGLSTATNAVISATDTVLSGLGKLQKQISDASTNLAGNVRSTVLTGYVSGTNAALAATDTLLAAFGKVQAQLDAKATLASPALSGTPTGPTAASGTNTLQLSNTAFVQQEIAKLISSAPGALDTLAELAAAMGNDANFAATMTTALAGKEPSITADLVSSFYSGSKTWRDLPTDVRAVVLTGLSVATNSAVVAGDSILVGLGKLQAQVTALGTSKLSLSGGTLSGALNEAPPVTLASAATVNIGAAAANSVTISGTTTITAFDTVAAGITRKVTFSGALTLTHNATSLQLLTGASIATAAGDTSEFVSLGAGNWDCLWYQRANGKAIGLGNVDNTSDANKPISTATQTALNQKADAAGVVPPGMTGDFATLLAPTGWLDQDGAAVSRTTYAALFAVMSAAIVGNTTSGSAVIAAVAATNAMWVGMPISGPGIPAGATVLSIVTNTSVTLSANATATATGITATICPYGVGNGTTTFNVPDKRGRVGRGWDNGAGVDVNRVLGSLQADQNASHTHGVTDPSHAHSTSTSPGTAYTAGGVWGGTAVGGGTGAAVTGISIQASGGTEARMKNTSYRACIKY
jgi:microcystin-dependent protein